VYLSILKNLKSFFSLKKANEDESENEIDEDDVKANGGIRKNSIVEQLVTGNGNKRKLPSKKPVITIIVDLAFSTNVRFLDDHELYLDNVELYRTLPFASGQAVARGILDSLMSTTYFNASALRLIRSWVTGGATIELELALAEGAGLRGGYSTPDTLKRRDRFKMEKIELKESNQFSHMVIGGYTFGDLFGEASTRYGMLCVGLFRNKGPTYHNFNSDDPDEFDESIRVVLTAPDKDMLLETDDIAFMLVQYEHEAESTTVAASTSES